MSSEIARKFLSYFLDEYIENFNSETSIINLWEGSIQSRNLLIRPNCLDKLNLPVKLSYGKISKFELSFPIKSFLIGIANEIILTIDKIELFVKTNSNWEFFDYTSFDYKSTLVNRITESLLFRLRLNQDRNLNNTYFNSSINYIVDNIVVNIKDISLIFEDIHSHQLYKIFCGFKIGSISINNKNKNDNNSQIYKKFQVEKVFAFLIPISNYENSKRYIFQDKDMNCSFINDNSSIFSGLKKEDETKLSKEQYIIIEHSDKDYLLAPITINVNLNHIEQYKYHIEADLTYINFKLTNEQFICLLSLIRFMENYRQFFKNCYSLRKLNYFKPKDKKQLLLHYFHGVFKLIREKRLNKDMFPLFKSLSEYEKIFKSNYSKYFINNSNINDDLKEVIRYVDIPIIKQWIKDEIANIYRDTNYPSNPFSYALSWFYSNTVQTELFHKQLENDYENIYEITFNITVKYVAFGLTNTKNESSKFILRGIGFDYHLFPESNVDEKQHLFGVDLYIDEARIEYMKNINKSSFKNDILIRKNKNKKSIITTKFNRDGVFTINILSHDVIYNQNMLSFIFSFFTVKEFDVYSKKLFSLSKDVQTNSNEINNNNENNNIVNNNTKIKQKILFDINTENYSFIFPFKSPNQTMVINTGNFNFKTFPDDKCEFSLTDINLTFNNDLLVNKFNISFESKDKVIKTKLSDIKVNLTNITIEKLIMSYQEVFTVRSDKEIWMTQLKQKKMISDNAVKYGGLQYKRSVNSKWQRYYCLLSGGYIYLFENSANDSPDLLIPLTDGKVSEVKEVPGENGLYAIEIGEVGNEGRSFLIGNFGETVINEWKVHIERRILEINSGQKGICGNNKINNGHSIKIGNSISNNEIDKSSIHQLATHKKDKETLKKVLDHIIDKWSKSNVSQINYSNSSNMFYSIMSSFEINKLENIFHLEVSISSFDILLEINSPKNKNHHLSTFNINLNEIFLSFSQEEILSHILIQLNTFQIITSTSDLNNKRHLFQYKQMQNSPLQCTITDFNEEPYSFIFSEKFKKYIERYIQQKSKNSLQILSFIESKFTKTNVELNISSNISFLYQSECLEDIFIVSQNISEIVSNSTMSLAEAVETKTTTKNASAFFKALTFCINTKEVNISFLNKKQDYVEFTFSLTEVAGSFSYYKSNNIDLEMQVDKVEITSKRKQLLLVSNQGNTNGALEIKYETRHNKNAIILKVNEEIQLKYYHWNVMLIIKYLHEDILPLLKIERNIKQKENNKNKHKVISSLNDDNNIFGINCYIREISCIFYEEKIKDNLISSTSSSVYWSCNSFFNKSNISNTICYKLILNGITYSTTNEIKCNSIKLNSKNNFTVFTINKPTIFNTNYVHSNIIIAPVNILLRKKDYDNLYKIISSYDFSYLPWRKQTSKSFYVNKEIFEMLFSFKIDSICIKCILDKKDKENVVMGINKIDMSLSNYTNQDVFCVKIGNIYLKYKEIFILNNELNDSKNDYYNTVMFYLSVIWKTNKCEIDFRGNNLMYNIKYDIYYMLQRFFSIEYLNTQQMLLIPSNNNNLLSSIQNENKKVIPYVYVINIMMNKNLIYIQLGNELLGLRTNVFMSFVINETNQIEAGIQLQGLNVFTSSINLVENNKYLNDKKERNEINTSSSLLNNYNNNNTSNSFHLYYKDCNQTKTLFEPTTINANIKYTFKKDIDDNNIDHKRISIYFTTHTIKIKLSFEDILQISTLINDICLYFNQYQNESYLFPCKHNNNNSNNLFYIEESIYIPPSNLLSIYTYDLYIKTPSINISLFHNNSSSSLLFNLSQIKFIHTSTYSEPFNSKYESRYTYSLSTSSSISYFSHSMHCYIPFIEQFQTLFSLSYSPHCIYSSSLSISNDLNINVTHEIILYLNDIKSIIKSIHSNKHIDISSSTSNISFLLINYSGEDIELNDYTISNGNSFDLDSLDISNIALIKIGQHLKFTNVNLNIFSLRKDNLNNNNNTLCFVTEIQNAQKRFVFYTKFLIESLCYKNITVNNWMNLKYKNIIGMNKGDNLCLISNANFENENMIDLTKEKNRNVIKLENYTLNIEKINLDKINEKIYKIKILPNVIIQNCLDMQITLTICKINQDITIQPNSKEHQYFNRNFMDEFKLKFEKGNFKFKSKNIRIYPNKNNETTVKINITDADFIIKVNYIEEQGVLYLYLYCDYLIVNNTPFDIYPKNSQIELIYDDETNYTHMIRYYPISNFDLVQLVINEGNNNIIYLDDIHIEKKNYAFFQEISVCVDKSRNHYVKFLLERHLRYFKFTHIQKVDILQISLISSSISKDNYGLIGNDLVLSTPIITSNLSRNSSKSSLIVTPMDEILTQEETSQLNQRLSNVKINIKNINISLIAHKDKIQQEIALININGIVIVYLKELRNNNIDLYQIIEIRVRDIQIDNMTNDAVYKVVLSRNMFISNDSADNSKKEKNFIYFITEFKSVGQKTKLFDIEKLIINLHPISISLDSEFACDVIEFIFNLQSMLNAESFYFDNTDQVIASLSINQSYNGNNNNKLISINHLKTSPITIIFSYKNISNRLVDILNIKNPFIQTVIDFFASTAHITILLNMLELTKVNGNAYEIIDKIRDYYYYNLIRQVVKLIFSIDILGNPIELLERLGEGVKDFFYYPIMGVVGGPSEFLFGSYSGTKSLISHAVGGVFDSISKVTHVVGKVILKLSDSEEYLQKKQEVLRDYSNKKKDKITTMVRLMGNGLLFGVRDLVYFPYMYTKNKGMFYFLEGGLNGISSAVVKPLSGVLDFVSFGSKCMAKVVLIDYAYKTKRERVKKRKEFYMNEVNNWK